MSAPDRWGRVRIHLFNAGFVLLFLVVLGRAWQLQVHSRDKFQERAEQQQQRVVPVTPQRGTIYDVQGKELAVSLEVDSIYAHPGQISDKKVVARQLAKSLKLSRRKVLAKLQSGKSFVWLKRRVSPQESDRVKELKLGGVGITREHKRYYPNSRLGAQIVGFTGVDPNGLEGIELHYDSDLLGRGGYLISQRDALGRGLTGEGRIHGGHRGNDLFLTLDQNLQYVVQKELRLAVKEHRAKSGSAVVMEVDTGRVVAMASYPDYNPNALAKYRPGQWRNRPVADAYEPGSTLKVFLMAAALQENIVRPNSRINCEKGSYSVGGQTIHDRKPFGRLRASEVLKYSSNIGSAKIGQKLGRERLHEYLTAFGFGERSGVDLPGEVGGLLRAPRDWFEIDLAAISFGQGLTVTPLQLATATSAIANGGRLMRPYVVEKVVGEAGEILWRQKPEMIRRVVDEETAERVRAMMGTVVEKGGTGMRAAINGYRVAGKTGTSQKVDPVTGGYSVDKRVASFIGFAPLENPKLVIAVVVDEPKGLPYGGLVAAPVFAKVARQAMNYLQVPATALAKAPQLPPIPRGVTPVSTGGLQQVESNEPEVGRMPDFRGMSYREVMKTMEKTGLNIRLSGSGRVVEQSPAPHRPVRFGAEIWVRFAPVI